MYCELEWKIAKTQKTALVFPNSGLRVFGERNPGESGFCQLLQPILFNGLCGLLLKLKKSELFANSQNIFDINNIF
jgi:hypothetical protein